jgi:hypothetical protein
MTKRTLEDKLRSGVLGVRKIGKHWLIPYSFIIDYLSGALHNESATQATDKTEVKKCQSTKETEHGTWILSRKAESAYATLLKQPTKSKRKSTTTA